MGKEVKGKDNKAGKPAKPSRGNIGGKFAAQGRKAAKASGNQRKRANKKA